MSLTGSVQQMRESFEAQFEATEDDRYLYRLNQKGEPIPVTSDERERFVREYVRRIWVILIGMMAVLLASGGLLVWWVVSVNADMPEAGTYVGIAVIAVPAIWLMYWVRGAPARELRARTPVGRERSREEMRAILFEKLSYGQLFGAAALGAVLPFTLRSHPDVLHGWGRLWLVLSGSIILTAAIQAARKWHYDRRHQSDR